MVEETAGIIICCSPMTTKVFSNVKQPVISWLSSISQRRKSSGNNTGSSNSKNNTGDNRGYSGGSQGSQGPIYHQHGQQNEKGLVDNNNNNNSLQQIATNAIYDPINPQDGHAAWADANGKDEDMERLHPGVFGIEKKTEYQVSRDGLGH